jgi:hypothetical protein
MRQPRRRRVREMFRSKASTVVALLVALALVAGGCGSSSSLSATSSPAAATGSAASATSTTGTVRLAKTKFVIHAGLAFGAFHRWIYKPIKAGELTHPLSHKLTTVKAALAAGFVYHELKLALTDAQSDPTLSKIVAPVTALQTKIKNLGSSVKGGNPGTVEQQVTQANDSVTSISSQSASSGQPITETVPSHL